MKIEVESEALDSLKAMAQRLQEERDELLAVMESIGRGWCSDALELQKIARGAAEKCTAKPDILA